MNRDVIADTTDICNKIKWNDIERQYFYISDVHIDQKYDYISFKAVAKIDISTVLASDDSVVYLFEILNDYKTNFYDKDGNELVDKDKVFGQLGFVPPFSSAVTHIWKNGEIGSGTIALNKQLIENLDNVSDITISKITY